MAVFRMLDELATFLASKLTSDLFIGETLWIGTRGPTDPTNSTLIQQVGSSEDDPETVERDSSGNLTNHLRKDVVQVSTRNYADEDARDIQHKIYLVLHGRNDFTLTNIYVHIIQANNTPQLLGGTADEGTTYITNYEVFLRDPSTV